MVAQKAPTKLSLNGTKVVTCLQMAAAHAAPARTTKSQWQQPLAICSDHGLLALVPFLLNEGSKG